MTLMSKTLLIACLLILGAGCASRGRVRAPEPVRDGQTSCATGEALDSTIYDTTQVTEQPVPRTTPQLNYPEGPARRRVRGRVLVLAVVTTEGHVDQESVVISQSVHPALDAEARRFVTGMTLWPACLGNSPVRVRVAVPVSFEAPGSIFSEPAFTIGLLAGVAAMIVGAVAR